MRGKRSDGHRVVRSLGEGGLRKAPQRILIVEDQAHLLAGHFPVMFAELAQALNDVGWEVSVLTSEGWALENREQPTRMDLHQLGSISRATRGWILTPRPLVRRLPFRWRILAADAVVILAARRLRRRLQCAGVIITSLYRPDYVVLTALAGRGRWLLYRFQPPPRSHSQDAGAVSEGAGRPPREVGALVAFVGRVEEWRRKRGALVRIAVNAEDIETAWAAAAPWLNPIKVPFTACRELRPIPDARERLGLDPNDKIALLFGAPHRLKDQHVVFAAFEKIPEWRLVIAGGGAAEAFLAWSAASERSGTPPILLSGFASEETRDLLYAAADLIVLSFTPGASLDSGTLIDAVTWGRPCVCSSQSYAGEEAARLRLGPIFEAGDADSLMEAVRCAPSILEAGVIARAQSEYSARRMAELHLAALGWPANQ